MYIIYTYLYTRENAIYMSALPILFLWLYNMHESVWGRHVGMSKKKKKIIYSNTLRCADRGNDEKDKICACLNIRRR